MCGSKNEAPLFELLKDPYLLQGCFTLGFKERCFVCTPTCCEVLLSNVCTAVVATSIEINPAVIKSLIWRNWLCGPESDRFSKKRSMMFCLKLPLVSVDFQTFWGNAFCRKTNIWFPRKWISCDLSYLFLKQICILPNSHDSGAQHIWLINKKGHSQSIPLEILNFSVEFQGKA